MKKPGFTALATCLFLLLAAPALAGAFNAQSFRLGNGMHVVVIPNHRAPVVSHMVWYQVGGADEAPGKSGIAHFLEHLMFKGTPAVPDGAFSATVRKMGGNDNAFTSRDYTAYYQNIPREHLARVMEMEADRMKNLTLEEDEVASEREVIVEERRQRIDNQPQSLFQEQVMAALFINHPYAVPVIGWMHEIRGLTRGDALAHYRKWYAPNNAILIVSGDITQEDLRPLAEKYYGSLEPVAVPARRRPRSAPLNARHRLTLSDARVGMPVVMKIWRAPRGSDALDLLAEIAGGSPTSRLYRSLVVEKKLAVSAGMDYDPVSLDDTTITAYASPAPGVKTQELEAALETEIARLARDGVTQAELDSARSRKIAGFTYARDSLQGPAMLFGRALSSGFDISYLEEWPARIENMTAQGVNAAAALLSSVPVTGILLPEEGKR